MGRYCRTLMLLAGLAVASAALGQGMIIPDRWWEDRWVPVPPGTVPLRVQSEKVTADIKGFAATTVVEQSFHNQYGARIEGTFLFPLPEGAGVTNFSMTINGEEVAAELLDARRAREVYENIVRSMRDPGLLEYVGRDVFRARIFPIEPGEIKKVKLEYTHAVSAEDGLARFVFPLRARAGTTRPWLPHRPILPGERILPPGPGFPELPPPGVIGSLAVDVRIESEIGIKSVYSPSHEIDVHRQGESIVRVGHESASVVPESDFILYWQLSDEMFGLSLLCHRGATDDEGTFMMLLAPNSEVRTDEVQAKDIVFVFDVSGSMAGAKIEQAKNALRYCLNNLNEGDRFNVIAFSTAVDGFAAELQPRTPEKVAEALKFVDELRARGSTNIDEALKAGLAMLSRDPARPAMMLFLTDGLPTVGETKPQRILENAGAANAADARMFVFGVGNDVNALLLDKLSDDNRGTRVYVKPEEDIEAAVSGLYGKIASPVLSELKLTVEGVKVLDLQPLTLPDLFRGSQITLLGKYAGDGAAKVTLSGRIAGQPASFSYDVEFPRRERLHPFVPRLWATRKVGYLLDQIRLNGEDRELVEEVTELATKYGILTPYTSYLVLEPGMRPETEVADAVRARRLSLGMPGAPGMPAPGGADAGGFGGARPSDEAVGAGAIARSEGERFLREAERAGEPVGVASRQAAGRTFFFLDGDVWVDSTVPKETEGYTVIKVKYGSDAYFDLLGLREEMREVLALGTQLKVRFDETILVVSETEGDETLSDAARRALEE